MEKVGEYAVFVVGRAGFDRVFEDCTYSLLVTTKTLVSCRFWFQFNPRAPELPARSCNLFTRY